MDEPSKSERERKILYVNAYIWNLERSYQGSHLQSSKGDADIKNRLLVTVGDGKGPAINIFALSHLFSHFQSPHQLPCAVSPCLMNTEPSEPT